MKLWIVYNEKAGEGVVFDNHDDAIKALDKNSITYPTIAESFRETYPNDNVILEGNFLWEPNEEFEKSLIDETPNTEYITFPPEEEREKE